jgi:periplasmic protein TonB
MQFSHTHQTGNAKVGKFAAVAMLHAALAALFMHGLDMKKMPPSILPADIDVTFTPDRTPPPTPPDPPRAVQQAALPPVFVPQPVIETAPPPDPAPLQVTTSDPTPFPATPAKPVAEAPPATIPVTQAGALRSAVLADANGCALPTYPVRALRNGETGITTLALLVGVDGRVTSARVERSSGSRDLDQAAIHALSLCTFKPATTNGVPESGWAKLAYVWTLD